MMEKYTRILIAPLLLISFGMLAQNPRYTQPVKFLKNLEFQNRIILKFTDYSVETYVYKGDKKINTKDDAYYFWYAASDIKRTKGAYDGMLLHGTYSAFYTNKNLKEQGAFRYGIKIGVWKSWYPNGEYKEIVTWKDGQMDGSFKLYDEKGRLLSEGNYKDGKRDGVIYEYDADGKKTRYKYDDGEEKVAKGEKKKDKQSTEGSTKKGLLGMKRKSKSGTKEKKSNQKGDEKNPSEKKKKGKSDVKIEKHFRIIPLPDKKQT